MKRTSTESSFNYKFFSIKSLRKKRRGAPAQKGTLAEKDSKLDDLRTIFQTHLPQLLPEEQKNIDYFLNRVCLKDPKSIVTIQMPKEEIEWEDTLTIKAKVNVGGLLYPVLLICPVGRWKYGVRLAKDQTP